MTCKSNGLRVLDLFCGAGGFAEGFRQAGYDVVAGIDNWSTALETFEYNGLGEAIPSNMLDATGGRGYDFAKRQVRRIEEKHGRIDVLIGSPPCTDFSSSKNAGQGSFKRGMLLVRAHLVFVAALRPRFWLLENVPRLESAINRESEGRNRQGWYIPLEKLRVHEDITDWPFVRDGFLRIPYGDVYDASLFGTPQKRLRFIAGNVKSEVIGRKKREGRPKSMHDCLDGLSKQVAKSVEYMEDPNYTHHTIPKSFLTDYHYDSEIHPMHWEELRHLKTRHIQYGRIPFPDDMTRPSRTIMSTQNVSSRESIVIPTAKTKDYQGKERPVLRHLRVREAACLQGFPLGFQFAGNTLNTRAQQVGNAVPCQLSHALALAILDQFRDLDDFDDSRQQERLDETLRRLEANSNREIVRVPDMPMAETKDLSKRNSSTFNAKPDKHIRRKILSSKIPRSSGVVIFENTEWNAARKHHGGFWKSCLQMGVGKVFSQVYLDGISIPAILNAIDSQLGASRESRTGKALGNSMPDDAHLRLHKLVSGLIKEIDKGIPLVPASWKFNGYSTSNDDSFACLEHSQRLLLPSASRLQAFFTSDCRDTHGTIGAIDLFDGIDAVTVMALSEPESKWILETTVSLRRLRDSGKEMYKLRISDKALDSIDGVVPLTTLVAALVSVHVLYRMHTKDTPERSQSFRSLEKGWSALTEWNKDI